MWFALLLACGDKFENPESYEGDEAGECSDGADNDLDGLFDCNDEGCAGSPDCEGTDEPSDEPSGEPSGEPSNEPSGEPSNEPSGEDTGDTDEVPPPVCNPGSGELMQAGNLPVQIVGLPPVSGTNGTYDVSDFAGWDIAICDLDNDGFDDLAVGLPNVNDGLGRVAIYYGPGDAWSSFMNATETFSDARIVNSGANFGYIGQRIECGDINGDGAEDLVIGGGQGSVTASAIPVSTSVHAFYNTGSKMSGQVDLFDTADVRLTFNTAAGSTQWPSFWLEDVDGDGMKEILYFMNQNSFFGSAAGNADNKIWVMDADSNQMGAMDDHTVFKITPPDVDAVGDIRRVGNQLLIGQGVHYGASVQDGGVSLVPTPIGSNVSLSSQASATWTASAGEALGSSLAFDDFDQDGDVDMIIGAKGNGGAIHAYFSGWDSAAGNINGAGSADSSFTSNYSYAGLGQQMRTMGDVNDDGYPDLLVTALGDFGSGDSGKAYVVDGLCLDGQMTSNINAASHYQVTAEGNNDGFGWAAAVGDINGDGVNDFAVSAPYYMPDPSNGVADGKVYVWLSE